MSFLIFYLKQESLQIYRFSNNLVSIDKILSTDFLNLSENFENLWQNCSSIINLENEIYFILGQSASFTDTRIIYLWLRSWQMFGNLKVKKLENELFTNSKTNLNTNYSEKIAEFEKEKVEEKATKIEQLTEQKNQKNFISMQSIKQFWIHKLEQNLVLEFLENIELTRLFTQIKIENNQKLLYTSAARIGQNKISN